MTPLEMNETFEGGVRLGDADFKLLSISKTTSPFGSACIFDEAIISPIEGKDVSCGKGY